MTHKFQGKEWLQEILREAYLGKESLEVGEIDRKAIMEQIRQRGRLPLEASSLLENFENFVWRLAPIVGFSIILLIALTSILAPFDFLDKNGRSGLFEGASEELRLEQLFEPLRSHK